MNKRRVTATVGNRWARDDTKESFWKQQIAEWQRSGLSVRAYCKEQGIVETSFYAWRRELIIRARESGDAETAVVGSTPNMVKDGRGRTLRINFRQTDHAPLKSLVEEDQNANPFVQLSVVPEERASVTSDEALIMNTPNQASRLGISIKTPRGYGITVTTSDDLVFLKNILSILENA